MNQTRLDFSQLTSLTDPGLISRLSCAGEISYLKPTTQDNESDVVYVTLRGSLIPLCYVRCCPQFGASEMDHGVPLPPTSKHSFVFLSYAPPDFFFFCRRFNVVSHFRWWSVLGITKVINWTYCIISINSTVTHHALFGVDYWYRVTRHAPAGRT